MIGACRLNNKSMRNIRRNEVYQCLAIDLAMLGVISKEECEMLIGSGIPKGLVLPNGKQGELVSEENLPEKPDFIQTEPANADTQETGDDAPVDESPVDESLANADTQETGDNAPVDTENNTDVTMNGDDVNFTQSYSTGDAAETQEPADDEGRPESDN